MSDIRDIKSGERRREAYLDLLPEGHEVLPVLGLGRGVDGGGGPGEGGGEGDRELHFGFGFEGVGRLDDSFDRLTSCEL